MTITIISSQRYIDDAIGEVIKTLTETAVTRLDRDQPIEARVSRLPDLTHAASANT